MASDTPERIAIGVCTYNRGHRILRTLEALARMDPADTAGERRLSRVVIVDNRSSDDTAAVVDRFIAASAGSLPCPFARIYEGQPGKCAALRRLFALTSEEVVGVIDDDTLPDRGWAAGMLALLDDEPRAGAVGGPVLNVWESGPTRLARIYRRSLGDQLHGEERLRLDDHGAFLMGASTAYRRRAVMDSGWLQGGILECRRGATIECGEDAELCLRIRRAGWEIWYEPSARMGHLIPAARQNAAYLARLRESICRSEPWIRWMAEGRGREAPDLHWARAELQKARHKYLKTLLGDWRPARRRIRVAERRGRVAGWLQLIGYLEAEPDSAAGRLTLLGGHEPVSTASAT
jgi:glucosyl-dolichyl phosphate glucuronosyltransferase